MAQWHIFRKDNGRLAMVYVNLYTGQRTSCGECERSCPIEMLIEWIVTKGDAAPGDYISVAETGRVYHVSKVRGQA